jgi:hypothetical protein
MTETRPLPEKKFKINKDQKKRLSKGQRTHNRRLKQEARKTGSTQG